MNQSLVHADILLRDRARERERHVEEGRILRLLQVPTQVGPTGPPASPPDAAAQRSAANTLGRWLWSGLRFRLPRESRKPRLGSGSA